MAGEKLLSTLNVGRSNCVPGRLVGSVCRGKCRGSSVENSHLRVAVVFHRDFRVLKCFRNADIYFKIHAGSKISARCIRDAICDDAGENISDKNCLVNEITAIYWLWKHYHEIGNPDYIGLMHYRRHLDFQMDDLSENQIVAGEIDAKMSVRDFYAKIHHVEDLDLFCENLKREFLGATVAEKLDKFLRQNMLCPCNMFVMSRTKFLEYAEFMNKCLAVEFGMMQRHEINLTMRVGFQKRVYGYILERMTAFWLFMQQEKGLCNLVIRPITVYPEYECLPFWEQRLIDLKRICRKFMWWRGR